jgi:hypothetical protein
MSPKALRTARMGVMKRGKSVSALMQSTQKKNNKQQRQRQQQQGGSDV